MNPYDFKDYEGYLATLVHLFIRKTSRHLYENYEDLYQEAVVAFIECQGGYKPEYPFKPYLKASVFNHLTSINRPEIIWHKLKQDLNNGSTEYKEGIDYDYSELTNTTTCTRDSEEEAVYSNSIWDLVNSCESLTDKEVSVLECYLDHGGSCASAARVLGTDRQKVWRIISDVVEKLKVGK